MITNERQYMNTRAQAEKFERAIEEAKRAGPRPRVDQRIHEAMIEGMQSELGELRRQVRRYEQVKAGQVTTHKVTGIGALPDALIEARIAKNWTHKDLASQLGVPEQQVQRYESERYGKTGLDRLVRIAEVLGIRIAGEVKLPGAAAVGAGAKSGGATSKPVPARRSGVARASSTGRYASGSGKRTAKVASRKLKQPRSGDTHRTRAGKAAKGRRAAERPANDSDQP